MQIFLFMPLAVKYRSLKALLRLCGMWMIFVLNCFWLQIYWFWLNFPLFAHWTPFCSCSWFTDRLVHWEEYSRIHISFQLKPVLLIINYVTVDKLHILRTSLFWLLKWGRGNLWIVVRNKLDDIYTYMYMYFNVCSST